MISFALNESLATQYGGSSGPTWVKKAFDFSLNEAMGTAVPESIETTCAIVFSDISGFSKRMQTLQPRAIKEFLDSYYSMVMPIIYRNGGLIDQVLGDGIISVYSHALSPDVKGSGYHEALRTAESIVEACARHQATWTKCAMDYGQVVVCEIGDEHYRQATIVGNVMTVVHRLEAVAKLKSINMLACLPEAEAMYRQAQANSRPSGAAPKWLLSLEKANLAGVGDNVDVLYQKLC